MKSERNGILETAWRKFKDFIKSYLGSLHFTLIAMLIFFFVSCFFISLVAVTFFDVFDFVSVDLQEKLTSCVLYSILFGFFSNFIICSLFELLTRLPFKRKSSGSAPD